MAHIAFPQPPTLAPHSSVQASCGPSEMRACETSNGISLPCELARYQTPMQDCWTEVATERGTVVRLLHTHKVSAVTLSYIPNGLFERLHVLCSCEIAEHEPHPKPPNAWGPARLIACEASSKVCRNNLQHPNPETSERRKWDLCKPNHHCTNNIRLSLAGSPWHATAAIVNFESNIMEPSVNNLRVKAA